MSDDRATDLFFELFSGLPRQGPGDAASTRRALSMIPPLGPEGRMLDLVSGTGTQTLVLAEATPASILAIDFHAPFVEELNARAARAGVADRVVGRVGDLRRLEVPARSFDVVWSEGAMFVVGFDRSLEAWRDLLRPGGHVAVSELCWFAADPPAECREWLEAEYPAVRDVEANREAIRRAGYDLVGDFLLPPSSWWDDYYGPLGRNVVAFRARHAGDETAGAIASQAEREIETFRRHSDAYGYAFFVLRAPRG